MESFFLQLSQLSVMLHFYSVSKSVLGRLDKNSVTARQDGGSTQMADHVMVKCVTFTKNNFENYFFVIYLFIKLYTEYAIKPIG